VADVLLDGSEIIAHAPSLGFLCEKGSVIYMTLSATNFMYAHNSFRKTILGIHPKSAEKIVEFALKNNLIDSLKNLKELQREKKMLNSRFDFMGIDEQGHPFILEVKSVPLCDNNIAYFPGSHKKNACISPRALKHIQELQHIKENYRTLLCFVVQRQDATTFRINDKDTIYNEAVKEAMLKGVECIVLQVVWNEDGQCTFIKMLDS